MPRLRTTNPATSGIYDAEVMGEDHRIIRFTDSNVSRYEVSQSVAAAVAAAYPSIEIDDEDGDEDDDGS